MRYDQDHSNDQDQNDQTAHSQRISSQLAESVLPERSGLAHNILLSFLFISCFSNFSINLEAQWRLLRHLIQIFTGVIHVVSSLIQFNSRVDHLIYNISDQVHCYHQYCQENRSSHDQRIISVRNGLYKFCAQTADSKDFSTTRLPVRIDAVMGPT